MTRQLKIAIFSGSIPSTTFIENVIEGVANYHQVYLFGVLSKETLYPKNVTIFKTPQKHFSNFIYSTYRVLLLLKSNPKDLILLYNEIKKYKKVYDRWIWFTKFLPIVLYRPDILHIQWARDIEFYYFLKEKFNCKIIVSLLGSHINYTPLIDPKVGEIYKRIFSKVDAFHAVSKAIAIEATKYGAKENDIKIIYSPIKSNTFKRFRIKIINKKNTIKLLSVGRHHWVKGYQYGIQSINILKKQGFECEYTILAEGIVPENLLFMTSQLGISENIVFKSGLNQQELFDILHQYDILLLPSLSEGIANVVLEAMALGIPVISTDCGGMPEVVKHKETGWLVPVRDSNAIADAVVEITQTSESELQRITQNAHEFVKTHFNAEDSIRLFLELYEAVYSSSNGKIPTSLHSSE